MKQISIILRGAPASGKSTIAKNLRDYAKKIVWLKIDNFKPFFSDDTDSIIEDVNKTALNTLEYLLVNGFSVVMEGIFQNPDYIKKAIDIASERNLLTIAYQLNCSLETLQKRDKEREGVKEGCREILADSVIERLYDTIQKNPAAGIKYLDTEKNTLSDCLDIINNDIQSQK